MTIMYKEIRTMESLLGASIINVAPPCCDRCQNDASGLPCAKLVLPGKGLHICVGK